MRNRLQEHWPRSMRVVKTQAPPPSTRRDWKGVLVMLVIATLLTVELSSAEPLIGRYSAGIGLLLVLLYTGHIFYYPSRLYDLRTPEGRERLKREADKFN